MQIEWPRAVPVAAFKTIDDNINITLFTLVNDDKKK